MITDFEVGVTMVGWFTVFILLYIKAYYHFLYLKFEKNGFEDVESATDFIFRPWRSLNHLHEVFVIFWFPVFSFNKGSRKRPVSILSLIIGTLAVALIIFFQLTMI